MKTLAAVSYGGAKPPVIETLDLAEPRAEEVLVRIVASGVCHTDIMMNERPRGEPIVLGHEGAGIVERIGEGVEELEPGDHVALSFDYCGYCPSCARGSFSYCYEIMSRNFGGLREDGTSALSVGGKPVAANFFGQSSFSQFAIVQEKSAVKIAGDIPLEIAGPLGCGVITGAGSVLNAFELRPGQSVAVFGTGGVGLSAIMAARLAGASRIIAVDKVPGRLTLARELGATDAFNTEDGDAGKAIRKMLPYGVDFSLNTTSVPAIFRQATACLGMQGTAGMVIAPSGGMAEALGNFLNGGQRWRAILMGEATTKTFIPMLLDYWRQGRFPFDRLIKFYPFEKIADAFVDSEAGKTVKPVLRMPH